MDSENGAPQKMTPVLVVGAGPIGLTLALQLLRYGVACRIIDRLEAPTHLSKALVVWPRTERIFQQLGVRQEFEEQSLRATAMHWILAKKKLLSISFPELLKDCYAYPLGIAQYNTEKILIEKLQKLGMRVDRGTELIDIEQHDNEAIATLRCSSGRIEKVTCRWIVGCDGGKSTLRHLLKMPFVGKTYKELFLFADVKADFPFDKPDPRFYFSKEGTCGIFPVEKDTYRVMVPLDPKIGGKIKEPTVEMLEEFANERLPFTLKVKELVWLNLFGVNCRKVARFRDNHVFLAGDAAHVHSPAGGQGMNTGMNDAYNLGWKLAMVLRGEAPESLLNSYSEERERIAKYILDESGLLTHIASLRSKWTFFLREWLMSYLFNNVSFKKKIAERMSQLKLNYRNCSLSQEGSSAFKGGPKSGDLMLDEQKVSFNGHECYLNDILTGNGFSLLVFGGDNVSLAAHQKLIEISKSTKEAFGDLLSVYLIGRPNQDWLKAEEGTIILDNDLNLHKSWEIDEGCFYLIRPDGYIGYRGKIADKEGLLSYLDRLIYRKDARKTPEKELMDIEQNTLS